MMKRIRELAETDDPAVTIETADLRRLLQMAEAPQIEAMKISGTKRTILDALLREYPRGLTLNKLISEVYRGTREPVCADSTIRVLISRLRKDLVEYGWQIPNHQTGRSNVKIYRLVRC